MPDSHNHQTMTQLRRRAVGQILLWLAMGGALFLLLDGAWPDEPALRWRWAAAALALLGFNATFLWRHLDDNRDEQGRLHDRLGPGNGLSLLRGAAITLVGAFIVVPPPAGWLLWIPAILYTAADIADYFDGYLARISNHVTALGEKLDMEFDGLGMLLVTLLAVRLGQLPAWYLLLGLARYLFVAGLWWRQRRGKPIYPLHPSVHRRIFAGMQMGFMSVVLWPIVPPGGAAVAGTTFAIPTALGFLRDWLVVSGRLDPAAPAYRRRQQRVYRLAAVGAPPLLRLLAALGFFFIFRAAAPDLLQPAAWESLLAGWGLPAPAALATLTAVVALAGAAALTLGALARTAAIFLYFPLGFDIAANGLAWYNGLALAATICIMLLGSGPWSLWRPEEKYMLHRAGEPGFGQAG